MQRIRRTPKILPQNVHMETMEEDQKNFPFIKLPVTFLVHTANMKHAEEKYLQLLKKLNYTESQIVKCHLL